LDGCFESPEDAPPKVLFVIRAYLDETGHEGNDFVFIAGHAGYHEEWSCFVGKWLRGIGLQRNRLHMNELRWNDSAKKLLARLGPIPNECGLLRVIGGVKVSDYDDLLAGTKAEKLLKGYYQSLFIAVISLLHALPDNERVEIALEYQKEYERRADIILAGIAADPQFKTIDGKSKIACWRFMPKNDNIMFDQADYLCYALLQKYRDESSKKARWCSPILGDGTFIGKVMSKDEIRENLLQLKRDGVF
jgi:hypothetical protein